MRFFYRQNATKTPQLSAAQEHLKTLGTRLWTPGYAPKLKALREYVDTDDPYFKFAVSYSEAKQYAVAGLRTELPNPMVRFRPLSDVEDAYEDDRAVAASYNRAGAPNRILIEEAFARARPEVDPPSAVDAWRDFLDAKFLHALTHLFEHYTERGHLSLLKFPPTDDPDMGRIVERAAFGRDVEPPPRPSATTPTDAPIEPPAGRTPQPNAVDRLLAFIAAGESEGLGGYDAKFGLGSDGFPGLTEMTLSEVLRLPALSAQSTDERRSGRPAKSSAAGRYQLTRPTLRRAANAAGFSDVTTIFSPRTQDLLAFQLLKESGLDAFLSGGRSAFDEFADALWRIWPSIPNQDDDAPRVGDERLGPPRPTRSDFERALQDLRDDPAPGPSSAGAAARDGRRRVLGPPRGLRLDNPGALIRNHIEWEGLADRSQMNFTQLRERELFVFEDSHHGVRAMARLLYDAQRLHRKKTVSGMLRVWSRYSLEAPIASTAYAERVAKAVGVASDEPFDFKDETRALPMLKAMIKIACGSQPYEDDLLTRAYRAALDVGAPPRRATDDPEPSDPPIDGATAHLVYANRLATRNKRVTRLLERRLIAAVTAVYGPEATVAIYSGGQDRKGARNARRTGGVRHDDFGKGGRAADVYVYDADDRPIVDYELAKLGAHWLRRRYGSVGFQMNGGGIHLDEWTTPPPGGGLLWTYDHNVGKDWRANSETLLRTARREADR